jgi:ATP-dependent exoDNAse (exonuclease V) alpha subunit
VGGALPAAARLARVTGDFAPTPAQDRVLTDVDAWLREPPTSRAPFKVLHGFAGTGKTSVARLLARDRRVLHCAFTGKAAARLREVGCADAVTLHRAIYRPEESAVDAGDGTRLWTTTFRPRDDEPLAGYDLVHLDECSMADAKMARDLLAHGVPVLVSGDPFQLPPVSGEGYFSSKEPDWLLTEVHRQAAESGILRLATDVRAGAGPLAPDAYGPDCAVISSDQAAARERDLLEWCDVVVVGTHLTRRHFIREYRRAAARASPLPGAGEPLVCLQNDHRRGLLNGQIWRCLRDARPSGAMRCEVPLQDDSGARIVAEAWTHDFLDQGRALDAAAFGERRRCARFDFGYALTCHKAQGSEYDRVLVIDESSVFREHASRWLYTAATRAKEQLVVVRD